LRILLQTAFHEAITATDKKCDERKANEGNFPKEIARPILGKLGPVQDNQRLEKLLADLSGDN